MDFFDLMFQIANKPSIYVLDTPGVLVPSISDIETGLKLALAGTISIEDIYILIHCAKKESH
jgi:ribosome biogenesis GTPase A